MPEQSKVTLPPSVLVKKQVKSLGPVYYEEDGHKYRMYVELRYDDRCGNKHNTFTVTADIREKTTTGGWHDYMLGCCHEKVAKYCPEMAPYLKWHHTSSDGPMYYIENAVHHASGKDCWGRRAGEPSAFAKGVLVGNSPITTILPTAFWEYLKAKKEFLDSLYGPAKGSNPAAAPEEVVAVPHGPSDYATTFSGKYTLKGYPCAKWHEAPFDNIREAEEFALAFNTLPVQFVIVPTAFSEGKVRELGYARSTIVWPEATDEQLMLPEEELTALLLARLPKLMEEFKADMERLGFVY